MKLTRLIVSILASGVVAATPTAADAATHTVTLSPSLPPNLTDDPVLDSVSGFRLFASYPTAVRLSTFQSAVDDVPSGLTTRLNPPLCAGAQPLEIAVGFNGGSANLGIGGSQRLLLSGIYDPATGTTLPPIPTTPSTLGPATTGLDGVVALNEHDAGRAGYTVDLSGYAPYDGTNLQLGLFSGFEAELNPDPSQFIDLSITFTYDDTSAPCNEPPTAPRPTATTTTDTTPAPAPAPAPTTKTTPPTLGVSIRSSRSSVSAGQSVRFTVRTSAAKADASNVRVCATMPRGLTVVGLPRGATRAGRVVCTTIPFIAAGKAVNLTINTRATASMGARALVAKATASNSVAKATPDRVQVKPNRPAKSPIRPRFTG